MEKHFFKVRRLLGYAGKNEILGIVVPNVCVNGYPERLCYTTDFYTLQNEVFKNINLERHMDSKIVRINNKELKERINTFIAEAKKAFNLKKKFCEEQIKFAKAKREMDAKFSELQNSFVEAQGFLSKDDFSSHFKVETVKGYRYGFNFDGFKLKAITLRKEVCLGKYLNECSYDFLYEEYDGNLFVDDDCIEKDNSEDFRKIKSENFRKITSKNMEKHKITENFYAQTGDKRSAYIEHLLSLYFDKPIELKESNVQYVKELKNKFKELLT